jgi:hypothetical protein
MEAIRGAVEHNPISNFIPLTVAICCSFWVTLADLTFLTPDWGAFKCYWYRFGRFQNTGNHPCLKHTVRTFLPVKIASRFFRSRTSSRILRGM